MLNDDTSSIAQQKRSSISGCVEISIASSASVAQATG
jgi:hypothetical protein